MAIIPGNTGDNQLWGTESADTILAYNGSDELHGLGGNDILHPGPGGGLGDWDYVYGDGGFDTVA